jgi:hypothetical protein
MFITRLDENNMDENILIWMKFLQINNIKPQKIKTFLIKKCDRFGLVPNLPCPLGSKKMIK